MAPPVLLLLAGLLAIALGVALMRQGYVALRRTPDAPWNRRLMWGALLLGVGIALGILGIAMWLVFD
jgi:hypothetical protein